MLSRIAFMLSGADLALLFVGICVGAPALQLTLLAVGAVCMYAVGADAARRK